MRSPKALLTTPAALAGLLAVLAGSPGCAPSAAFRAPTPMLPGQTHEIGFGFTGGIEVAPKVKNGLIGNVDFWYQGQVNWFGFGVRGFAGTGPQLQNSNRLIDTALGLGVILRGRVVNLPNFQLAIDLNGGAAYGQLSVPIAVRAADRVWFYTAPGVLIFGSFERGAGIDLGLPLGLSVRATHYLNVLFEATAHMLGPSVFFFDGSVAAAFRF